MIEFLRFQGGDWEAWPETSQPRPPTVAEVSGARIVDGHVDWKGIHIYAIRYSDGVTWDVVNGFRSGP